MNKHTNTTFDNIDKRITSWMAKYGLLLLRLSVGVIFFWFGILKFFPGHSPAQDLAIRTIDLLTFGLIPGSISIYLLASWEVLIGIGLLTGIYMRITLFLLFAQMLGTMSPVFLFPHEVFTRIPYAPTLEGQYIIKNLIIISAALVIGATVRKEIPHATDKERIESREF
ncbi:MAG TPA: DoxX family protein [Bacteroidales bacterium]|nr:DoxX family protein [Bacteroidales bacterium]